MSESSSPGQRKASFHLGDKKTSVRLDELPVRRAFGSKHSGLELQSYIDGVSALVWQQAIRGPHPSERAEVPPAGCRALAAIQEEDLSEAEQEEHGAQHHHALLQLHVHAGRPLPPPHLPRCRVCIPCSDWPPHP